LLLHAPPQAELAEFVRAFLKDGAGAKPVSAEATSMSKACLAVLDRPDDAAPVAALPGSDRAQPEPMNSGFNELILRASDIAEQVAVATDRLSLKLSPKSKPKADIPTFDSQTAARIAQLLDMGQHGKLLDGDSSLLPSDVSLLASKVKEISARLDRATSSMDAEVVTLTEQQHQQQQSPVSDLKPRGNFSQLAANAMQITEKLGLATESLASEVCRLKSERGIHTTTANHQKSDMAATVGLDVGHIAAKAVEITKRLCLATDQMASEVSRLASQNRNYAAQVQRLDAGKEGVAGSPNPRVNAVAARATEISEQLCLATDLMAIKVSRLTNENDRLSVDAARQETATDKSRINAIVAKAAGVCERVGCATDQLLGEVAKLKDEKVRQGAEIQQRDAELASCREMALQDMVHCSISGAVAAAERSEIDWLRGEVARQAAEIDRYRANAAQQAAEIHRLSVQLAKWEDRASARTMAVDALAGAMKAALKAEAVAPVPEKARTSQDMPVPPELPREMVAPTAAPLGESQVAARSYVGGLTARMLSVDQQRSAAAAAADGMLPITPSSALDPSEPAASIPAGVEVVKMDIDSESEEEVDLSEFLEQNPQMAAATRIQAVQRGRQGRRMAFLLSRERAANKASVAASYVDFLVSVALPAASSGDSYLSVLQPGRPHKPLQIMIVGARGLRDADWLPGGGVSDPYCICEILTKPMSKVQTPVLNNTLNPVWNHEAEFPDYVPGDIFLFKVYDSDVGKQDDFLGSAVLESHQFYPFGFIGELPLSEAGTGISAFVKLVVQPAEPERRAKALKHWHAATSHIKMMRAVTEAFSSRTATAFSVEAAVGEEAAAKVMQDEYDTLVSTWVPKSSRRGAALSEADISAVAGPATTSEPAQHRSTDEAQAPAANPPRKSVQEKMVKAAAKAAAVSHATKGLLYLKKEAGHYCQDHATSEKRAKQAPASRACRGCLVMLQTNYTSFAFCPGCSVQRKACMICGADVELGENTEARGNVDKPATASELLAYSRAPQAKVGKGLGRQWQIDSGPSRQKTAPAIGGLVPDASQGTDTSAAVGEGETFARPSDNAVPSAGHASSSPQEGATSASNATSGSNNATPMETASSGWFSTLFR